MRPAHMNVLFVTVTFVATACVAKRHDRVQVGQSDCVVCHADAFANATDPVHTDYFPTTCGTCHNEEVWIPYELHHPWALSGAHATAICESCHTGTPPRWAGTPEVCVDCHRDDFDGSTFTGHATFSTRCSDCHSTVDWTPALGPNHPEREFPLRGAHGTVECLTCHDLDRGSAVDGMNTNCTGCHAHELSRMDAKHHGVRNYVSDPVHPNFCLSCHPDGD